jgi:predicted enzyme related to lactoylglutathione lyase
MKIMTKMNPVVHFEMPADDRNRMAVFYQEAFGWKAQMLGPEMGEYVVVTTADSDAKPGAPAGAINGAAEISARLSFANSAEMALRSLTGGPVPHPNRIRELEPHMP